MYLLAIFSLTLSLIYLSYDLIHLYPLTALLTLWNFKDRHVMTLGFIV